MSGVICLDSNYSTMRRITSMPPKVMDVPEAKFKSVLFLPPHPQRKGEGGMRTQGHFKAGRCYSVPDDSGAGELPLVTVITSVLNGAETLEQTILSVFGQSYANIEYIIIDAGSADGTLDIIRKHEHAIDYWISEPDGGIYDAWNKGVSCASGDWICFLGGDDYFLEEEVLARIAPFMAAAYPVARLVYGSVAVVNAQKELLYVVGEAWKIAKGKLGDIMSVPHPGMLHHRTWFEDYGLFDISYSIAGDYEMLLRGWPQEGAVFVPDLVVVGMVQGGVSSTPGNAMKQLREVRRAQKSHGIILPGRRLVGAFFRVYMRLVLQAILGERITYRLLDMGRKVLGKKPCWTKI